MAGLRIRGAKMAGESTSGWETANGFKTNEVKVTGESTMSFLRT